MLTHFAIRLICGMSVVWCVMPRAKVTSGFFRIQMLVTLGLSVLAAMAVGQMPSAMGGDSILSGDAVRWISVTLAVLSFLGSVMWTLERRAAGGRFAFVIAAVATATAVLSVVSTESLRTLAGNLYWLTELSTAAVSGAAVGGMLLGHWYLTAPTMSTSPLNRVNFWLGSAAAVRLLVGAVALCVFWPFAQSESTAADSGQAAWTSTYTVWLTLEWLGGILGPLAVSFMVVRILRYRNTQSATGVLFVGVILAFIGEMTGALLRRELQLPL